MGPYGWVGLGTIAVFLFRRVKRRRPDPGALRANFGERVTSPDDTGAIVTVLTNAQGIELYSRCWGAQKLSSPRAIVLLIHGGMWHSRYFEEFGKVLVDNGFIVYTFDLQSQGLSGSARGLRGDVERFDDIVDDVDAVLDFARGNHLNAPVFVYGESMGALIALLWALKYGSSQKVNGLILAGSALHISEGILPPRMLLPLLGAFVKLFPNVRHRSDEYEGTFDDAFGDPSFPEQARKDPLVVFQTPTLRFMLQGLGLLQKLSGNLADIELPFLALHGSEDVRCSIEGSRRLYEEASSEDKTFKTMEGMKHQLLQEPPKNRTIVFDEIVGWLKERTTPPAPAAKKTKKTRSSVKFDLPDAPYPAGGSKAFVDHGKVMDMLAQNGF
ncbi:hypothetical protein BSKO_00653 [Bryopsis sp. KO-2023]|nr:hypothetical protein BSKO_00653 [Bryopsis sp. KO-2023]